LSPPTDSRADTETLEATVQRIAAGLAQLEEASDCTTPSPADAASKLGHLAHLLADWGQRINLSGHKTPTAIADRLILDAAALLFALPDFSSLVDLGSGAGFPGLPIAILRPSSQVLLVEPRLKRNHFQRAALRDLGLKNVETSRVRMEEEPPRQSDVVLAQAVGPAADVFAGMKHWAVPRGTLGIPASERAEHPVLSPELGRFEERRDSVPAGAERRLWLLFGN